MKTNHRSGFVLISTLCGVLIFGFAAVATAQVPKSGKVTFRLEYHMDAVSQRFPGNALVTSGRLSGIARNVAGKGFVHNMSVECSWSIYMADMATGDWPHITTGCIYRDKDGDVIFMRASCSRKTYAEWCEGKITGGTGKYEGITGSDRGIGLPGNNLRRRCITAPKAADCKASYDSSLSVPVGVTYKIVGELSEKHELEWRIE